MSDKTNDEKLRILKERLAQIKEKDETASAIEVNTESKIELSNTELKTSDRKIKPILFKLFIFSFCIAFGVKYIYNSLAESNEQDNTKEIKVVKETLAYSLDMIGDNIAIISTLEDESTAKAMVNDLKVKGFEANYFYLPNKSNSTKKVYKVYIGPFENQEETNQWVENIEDDFEIIPL
jgi:hypothetical protein